MALEAAVHKRLADWRDKLIDLSRANRLLNYSPRSGSSIRVVEEDPQEIAELLLAGKTLLFDPMSEDHEPLADGAPRSGDLRLQTTLEPDRLHKVLTRLYRESRASIEEQGFNTLHLGLGPAFLHDPGGSARLPRPAAAPTGRDPPARRALGLPPAPLR